MVDEKKRFMNKVLLLEKSPQEIMELIFSCVPESPGDNSGFAHAVESFYGELHKVNNKLFEEEKGRTR